MKKDVCVDLDGVLAEYDGRGWTVVWTPRDTHLIVRNEMATNRIICGDSLQVLGELPRAKMIFADPPDNKGAPYKGFSDKWQSDRGYGAWFERLIGRAVERSAIAWISYNAIHAHHAWRAGLYWKTIGLEVREILWRYTFGQHNKYDCTGGYRPMMRIRHKSACLYPSCIRVQSARQRTGDKRAAKGGRVPDAVWEVPRIVGNAKERRKWAFTQHPEALVERMVKLCCGKEDLVIDMFGHSFTTARVCQRLGIDCISIEISDHYCQMGARELGVKEIEVL